MNEFEKLRNHSMIKPLIYKQSAILSFVTPRAKCLGGAP